MKNEVLGAAGVLFERQVGVEAVVLGGELEGALEVGGAAAGAEAALEEGLRPVGDHLGGVELVAGAEAVAGGAGAVGGVEREAAGLELGHVDAAVGAGQAVGVEALGAVDDGDGDQAAGELQGGVEGSLQALLDAGLDEQAIDHDFDGVVAAAVEAGGLVERAEGAVDAGAGPALAGVLLELLAEFALAAADYRGQDHNALGLGRFGGRGFSVVVRLGGVFHDGADNLLGGLAGDGLAAAGAVRGADGAVEEPEVVVDFGDGADGGAGGAGGGLLLDGDGGGEALDGVHVGALELVEELAGVGGEGLDVAALAFGVEGVEGEGGLAGAGEAGDYGEGVAGDGDGDVLEVVGAGAADGDVLDHSVPSTEYHVPPGSECFR